MGKYRWSRYYEVMVDEHFYHITTGVFDALKYNTTPLPKHITEKLKLLMACPIGFEHNDIGRRRCENTFVIYDKR